MLHETGIGLHRSHGNLWPASSIVRALFSSPFNFYLSSSSFRKILNSFPAALAVSEFEFQDPRPLRTGAQRKVFSSVRPRQQEVLGFPEGWGGWWRGALQGFPRLRGRSPSWRPTSVPWEARAWTQLEREGPNGTLRNSRGSWPPQW